MLLDKISQIVAAYFCIFSKPHSQLSHLTSISSLFTIILTFLIQRSSVKQMKEQASKSHDGVNKINKIWEVSVKLVCSKELGI